MFGHGGDRRKTIWCLDRKGEKTPAYFSVDGYDPETNTVYQFHVCHCHGHTCMKKRTERQKMRYKDT